MEHESIFRVFEYLEFIYSEALKISSLWSAITKEPLVEIIEFANGLCATESRFIAMITIVIWISTINFNSHLEFIKPVTGTLDD